MVEKVTAVHRIVEVLPFRIAKLTRLIVAAIDTTLRAHAVGTLHRREAD